MRRIAPLSPTQSHAYAMARALILFDTWWRINATPIDIERAILIDFGAQYPRTLVALLPTIAPVIRAHGLAKHDIADLFAQQGLNSARERFMSVVTALSARDLVTEVSAPVADRDAFLLKPTALGQEASQQLASPMSMGYRALYAELCQAWHSRSPNALISDIRNSIPDDTISRARLVEPFAPWLADTEAT